MSKQHHAVQLNPAIFDCFKLDPESPSYLSWVKHPSPFANVKEGQHVGNVGGNGYFRVKFLKQEVGAHRIVWALNNNIMPDPELEVDHIDRNPLNNHPYNLRMVTRKQNSMNRGVSLEQQSEIAGLSYDSRADLWNYRMDGKSLYFRSVEAAKEYLETGIKEETIRRDNKTGYRGVTTSRNGKFVSCYDKKHLGTFITAEEARDAFIEAKQEKITQIIKGVK